MNTSTTRRALLQGAAALALVPATARAQRTGGGLQQDLGSRFSPDAGVPVPRHIRFGRARAMDSLREWHEIALEATGIDHTPVAPGETRHFGEQLGPGRSSRAMAIIHIAMFDAVNAIAPRWRGYTGLAAAPRLTSMDAAIAQAAHDTLVALYPSQASDFDAALAQDLAATRDLVPRANGVALGQRAAAAILALRANDGANHPEPRVGVDYLLQDAPGAWQPDPVSQVPLALGAHWGTVTPFVLRAPAQFRAPPPAALDSAAYAAAFAEAQRLGGDGVITPTVRTEAQRQTGVFWAYDGMPSLCAPPRLYNQIALRIADIRHTPVLELARLLALVNIAMADAGVASWESKYHYVFWRPVTGIRVATGARLTADPTFTPLGAPASNLTGPNFTPPFPAYPSGHATFGGALFQVLRRFYGTDRIPFTFISDEFNGHTADNTGQVRPQISRSYARLSDAEEENGQSRIYLGIHWSFDKTAGIAQGRQVADEVVSRVLLPA
jgi:hypothetical protein